MLLYAFAAACTFLAMLLIIGIVLLWRVLVRVRHAKTSMDNLWHCIKDFRKHEKAERDAQYAKLSEQLRGAESLAQAQYGVVLTKIQELERQGPDVRDLARDLFGAERGALWFQIPNYRLGTRKPVELLGTAEEHLVREMLLRMAWGLPA